MPACASFGPSGEVTFIRLELHLSRGGPTRFVAEVNYKNVAKRQGSRPIVALVGRCEVLKEGCSQRTSVPQGIRPHNQSGAERARSRRSGRSGASRGLKQPRRTTLLD